MANLYQLWQFKMGFINEHVYSSLALKHYFSSMHGLNISFKISLHPILNSSWQSSHVESASCLCLLIYNC